MKDTTADYGELQAMTDRLCRLMNWEPGSSHKFEIIRQTCGGNATALSIEKGNQLAAKLEELMKELCDLQLASIGSTFVDEMSTSVTVDCPFCKTEITKDSEPCCVPMIACREISAVSRKSNLPTESGWYWIEDDEVITDDGSVMFVMAYLKLDGDELSEGKPVMWLWTPDQYAAEKPNEWAMCWDGDDWVSFGVMYTECSPIAWHPIHRPSRPRKVAESSQDAVAKTPQR